MIQIKWLSKVLASGGQPLTILHPLELSIPRGQFVAVMGPSGSGKSTLLGLMAGLDTPTTGEIHLDGQEITRMNEDQLARFRGRTLGFVFQTFQLIPSLTALENISLPLEIRGGRGASFREASARAQQLLERVGLTARGGHYPAQLSGGEQQRVAVARAFACRPPVLLADEPTGNLDSANGKNVMELLRQLHREEGVTLVLVTHDQEVAADAQRVVTIKDGRIVGDHTPGNTKTDKPPKAKTAKNQSAKDQTAKGKPNRAKGGGAAP
ncbi:MAG: ABC transporter ATP-binding protein [Deltaproteobacteria bacterium]|nr:ABC transporter ATP-binding protein [Deltaproteobacteria bacterium]